MSLLKSYSCIANISFKLKLNFHRKIIFSMVCYYITAFNKILIISYIGANYRFLQNHQSSISPSFKKSKGVKNDRQLPLPEIHKASGHSLASLHISLFQKAKHCVWMIIAFISCWQHYDNVANLSQPMHFKN